MKKGKFNLSFKRIISRIFLTGFVGILFGIAMMPFMTIADELLFGQRASIGNQNMMRMIAMWGIFTLIVTLITFWKKHFRMASVLLIFCWLISIIALTFLNIQDIPNKRCERPSGYGLPREFDRALDLIAQRMGIDERQEGTVIQSAFNYINCLNIQYLDGVDEEVEAYFLHEEDSNLQDLKIFINPYYKNFDDLTLATLLVHEIIHAGQQINELALDIKKGCYEDEAEAYINQAIFISSLNEEERRSIYTRIKDNVDTNPTFGILLLTDQRVVESYNECSVLQKKNNLSQKQFNQCAWTGAQNKILLDIKQDPYYQKQCAN